MDALRPELERACRRGSVADPARGEHPQRPERLDQIRQLDIPEKLRLLVGNPAHPAHVPAPKESASSRRDTAFYRGFTAEAVTHFWAETLFVRLPGSCQAGSESGCI